MILPFKYYKHNEYTKLIISKVDIMVIQIDQTYLLSLYHIYTYVSYIMSN